MLFALFYSLSLCLSLSLSLSLSVYLFYLFLISPIASLEISDVRMHPTRAERILASSMSAGCHETLEGPAGVDCYKIVRLTSYTT